MLWYLADGSLNEYLKSQVQLQGKYYSKQETQLAIADFSSSTGLGFFNEIAITNLDGYQTKYALTIDRVDIKLAPVHSINTTQDSFSFNTPSPFKDTPVLITNITQLTINKLTLNIEQGKGKNKDTNNINELMAQVKNQLAQDYPELYPEISVKHYAEKHPTLNAEVYAKNHPQSGPIIEHTQAKKKRGKEQNKIKIQAINIKLLTLNFINNGVIKTQQVSNLQLPSIGGEQGIVTDQLGGKLLLALFTLSKLN